MSPIPYNRVPLDNADLIYFARMLIRRHGRDAYGLAERNARIAREKRDLKRMHCWRRIAAFIRGLGS